MTEVQFDEEGRPEAPLSGNEAESLLGFLDYQRATLEWKCRDLSDEQLRVPLTPTAMTLAGLLMHLARVEDHWFSQVVDERSELEPWASLPWAAEWEDALTRSGQGLRHLWAERVAASRIVVTDRLSAGSDALSQTHPAWGGQGLPSLRWVLLHMIEEYARHNGHADLLRQAVDGSTGE